ncbi:MAG: hypothetical protein V5A36_05120 [Natronomonas sp.]
MDPSRRALITSGVSIATLGTLAGCSENETGNANANSDADAPEAKADSEPGAGSESDTATVTILAESLAGDQSHEDAHDDGDNDGDHDGLVSQAAIDEACGHMEFDDPESIDGSASTEEVSVIQATHQPFDITFDGDRAYVRFDVGADDDHDNEPNRSDNNHNDSHDDSMFSFFARGGEVAVYEGEFEEEAHNIECSHIDMYVAASSDHSLITLELTSRD